MADATPEIKGLMREGESMLREGQRLRRSGPNKFDTFKIYVYDSNKSGWIASGYHRGQLKCCKEGKYGITNICSMCDPMNPEKKLSSTKVVLETTSELYTIDKKDVEESHVILNDTEVEVPAMYLKEVDSGFYEVDPSKGNNGRVVLKLGFCPPITKNSKYGDCAEANAGEKNEIKNYLMTLFTMLDERKRIAGEKASESSREVDRVVEAALISGESDSAKRVAAMMPSVPKGRGGRRRTRHKRKSTRKTRRQHKKRNLKHKRKNPNHTRRKQHRHHKRKTSTRSYKK